VSFCTPFHPDSTPRSSRVLEQGSTLGVSTFPTTCPRLLIPAAPALVPPSVGTSVIKNYKNSLDLGPESRSRNTPRPHLSRSPYGLPRPQSCLAPRVYRDRSSPLSANGIRATHHLARKTVPAPSRDCSSHGLRYRKSECIEGLRYHQKTFCSPKVAILSAVDRAVGNHIPRFK